MKEVQARWRDNLQVRFTDICSGEWPAFRGRNRPYSPRLDLAVGPFALGETSLGGEYDALVGAHRSLLESMWDAHRVTLRAHGQADAPDFDSAVRANWNARCFLAIEIENAVTRKHLLGGIVNVVALGRLGVMVGWTDEKVRALIRARAYLRFLASVMKPTIGVDNLLILTREQAERAFARGTA